MEFGHFHGTLQHLLLFMEMSALSSTCDENSGANSFSYAATAGRSYLQPFAK